MIWLLWAFALLILLPMLLLIPRVRFSGAASPGELRLTLSGVGFRVFYDLHEGLGGRWFFFFGFKSSDDEPGQPTQAARPKLSFSSKPPEDSGQPKPSSRKPPGKWQLKEISFSGKRPFDRDLIILLIKRVLSLIWRLLQAVRADYIRATVTVATPDPMWTGIVFGALQPMMMWNAPPKREFHLLINFERETPVVEAEWSFSARPIRWAWIFMLWMAGLPWKRLWRAWKEKRKADNEKRKTEKGKREND